MGLPEGMVYYHRRKRMHFLAGFDTRFRLSPPYVSPILTLRGWNRTTISNVKYSIAQGRGFVK
jgi:hypothetical protein